VTTAIFKTGTTAAAITGQARGCRAEVPSQIRYIKRSKYSGVGKGEKASLKKVPRLQSWSGDPFERVSKRRDHVNSGGEHF